MSNITYIPDIDIDSVDATKEEKKILLIRRLRYAEYWTAPQASLVLNIPYKKIKKAFDDHDIQLKYFDSQVPKALASDVREWAQSAPDQPDGEWEMRA